MTLHTINTQNAPDVPHNFYPSINCNQYHAFDSTPSRTLISATIVLNFLHIIYFTTCRTILYNYTVCDRYMHTYYAKCVYVYLTSEMERHECTKQCHDIFK